MSENQTATKGPNQLKRTNHLINEQLAKIQHDTQELINRTIDIGQPAQVSVVKVSDNKIIIEVDLNEVNQKRTEPAVSLASQPDDCAGHTGVHKSVLRQQNAPQSSSTPKPNKGKQQDDSTARQAKTGGDSPLNGQQEQQENQPLKGILKYTHSWKKRTLSESSFDNSASFTDHEDEDTNFSLSLSCTDLDVYAERSASKRVTFNKQVLKQVIARSTSESAAGKKGKNGKKKNKKAKSNNEADRKTAESKAPKKPVDQEEPQPAASCEKYESIDELSFLLCSSESDGSNVDDEGAAGQNDEEDDLLDLQSKIEHQPFDEESWSEVKSSKRNRKRNDSGNASGEKPKAEHETADVAGGALSNCEQASPPMSLGMKRNLAIEVN